MTTMVRRQTWRTQARHMIAGKTYSASMDAPPELEMETFTIESISCMYPVEDDTLDLLVASVILRRSGVNYPVVYFAPGDLVEVVF